MSSQCMIGDLSETKEHELQLLTSTTAVEVLNTYFLAYLKTRVTKGNENSTKTNDFKRRRVHRNSLT